MVNNRDIKLSRMDNGIRIISERDQSVESVFIGVWVKTGTRNETQNIKGISHFLEHMMFKGTKYRSAEQIALEIDSIGGHCNAYTARENTAYYIKVLKENIDFAIDILADIMQNSLFDVKEIDLERGVILQEIAQNKDTPDEYVFDVFQEEFFPNQPMGYPILGTEDSVNNFTRDDLKNYIQQQYIAENIIITGIGNLEHDKFIDNIEQKFNSYQYKKPLSVIKAQNKANEHLTIYESDQQSHIIMGFDGVEVDSSEYYLYSLYAMLMGGGLSSRLFQEIREKNGLAYNIFANHSAYQDVGVFQIYAATALGDAQKTVDLIKQEIVKSKLISEAELQKGKNQLKSNLLMSQENLYSRAEQLACHMMAHDNIQNISDIINDIDCVKLEDISKMVKKYVN